MKFRTILILAFLSARFVGAKPGDVVDTKGQQEFQAPLCTQRFSDTTLDLWLAISNRMAITKNFGSDREQNAALPYPFSAAFPGGAESEYLYWAGIWVGGIKGNDTLVATSFEFNSHPSFPITEINPPPCPEGALIVGTDWADIEYAATAYDTIIIGDTLLRCQIGDCDDWYPLGIKVRSHSYGWVSSPFNRTVLMTYTITNIDSEPIREGWFGIYADCDIGGSSSPAPGDISGFLDGAFDSTGKWVDLAIAYSLDFNGDPGAWGYTDESANGVFGIQIVDLSVPDYRVNFNWWVRNHIGGRIWGPRQDEPEVRSLGDNLYEPIGDSNKYFVLSHPEVDYNEVESGLSHPGWLPGAEDGAAAASGGDTRFVISAGPFDLDPGDSVIVTVAYVAGDNAILDPFADYWFDATDPKSVSDYYEELDLAELIESGLAAEQIRQNGISFPPPRPPAEFSVQAYDDSTVSLIWRLVPVADLASYRVLRQDEGEGWVAIADLPLTDTTFTDKGLNEMTTYRYAVRSVDEGGMAGKNSRTIEILPGLPHAPASFQKRSDQYYPVLSWLRSIDGDIADYRLYRVDVAAGDTLLIAETSDTTVTDYDVAPGLTYRYFVTSVDFDGYESMPSESVTAIPLSKSSGIVVLNQNSPILSDNLLYSGEFLDTLLTRSLSGIEYDRIDFYDDTAMTVQDLADYSLVIVSSENRRGSLHHRLADVLESYMGNGGRVVFILRHAGTDIAPFTNDTVHINLQPSGLFNDFLHVDSSFLGGIYISSGTLVGELVGCQPLVAGLPPLTWDSVRINQFGFGIPDGIPYTGFLWPKEGQVEPIYSFSSRYTDSDHQGQITAVRYRGDDYGFYLLNFPLSLMQYESASELLRFIITDFGETYICGDINGDFKFNMADLVGYAQYLLGTKTFETIDRNGDVDCNGSADMADLIRLINFIFKRGPAPECCQ
jgi:hypothetical protein